MSQFIAHVTLLVRNYEEALTFFTESLGFQVREDSFSDLKRWLLVAPAHSTGPALLLARAATPDQQQLIGKQAAGRVFLFLHTDDFNRDFQVSFTKNEMAAGKMYYNYKIQNYPMEEGHGLSAFYQVSDSVLINPDVKEDEAGNIYHTYSTWARGTDILGSSYSMLDLTALGRQEDWEEPKGRAPRPHGADPSFSD